MTAASRGFWLAVLLYTGLRRGDAVRLGRQHIRHGVATLRTEKTWRDGHDSNLADP
jgi:integrase